MQSYSIRCQEFNGGLQSPDKDVQKVKEKTNEEKTKEFREMVI